jgi:hypothetical protein
VLLGTPLALLAVGLVAWAGGVVVLLPLVGLLGVEVPGEVTSSRVGGKGARGVASVTYRVGAVTHRAEVAVDPAWARQLKRGDPVVVRALLWAPGWQPHLPGRTAWIDLLVPLPLLPAVLVCFFAGVFVVSPWWRARTHHFLLSRGRYAPGAVVGKAVTRRKNGETFSVRYAYAAGREVEAAAEVGREEYESVAVGDPVAVLYDPGKPGRSLIYRFADYEVMPGAPEAPPG